MCYGFLLEAPFLVVSFLAFGRFAPFLNMRYSLLRTFGAYDGCNFSLVVSWTSTPYDAVPLATFSHVSFNFSTPLLFQVTDNESNYEL